MELSLNKKLPGQLKKPEPLVDIVCGVFVGYQGCRADPNLSHHVVLYLKKPGDTRIYEIPGVPEKGFTREPPINGYSNPAGQWVWHAGPTGVPTLVQHLQIMQSEFVNEVAALSQKEDVLKAKALIAEKDAMKTREEAAADITDQTKKVNQASRGGMFPDMQRGRRSDQTLTPGG